MLLQITQHKDSLDGLQQSVGNENLILFLIFAIGTLILFFFIIRSFIKKEELERENRQAVEKKSNPTYNKSKTDIASEKLHDITLNSLYETTELEAGEAQIIKQESMTNNKIVKSKQLSKNTIAFTSNQGHEDNTKWGVMNNETQEVILKEDYIQISYDPNSKVYICSKNIIIKVKNENVQIENLENYSPYKKELLYCVYDENFNSLIPYKYKYIEIVNGKYFFIRDENWNLGVLDISGNIIIDLLYNKIWGDSEGHFFVFSDKYSGEVGYLDFNGKVCFGYNYSPSKNKLSGRKNTKIFGFDSLPFDEYMYEQDVYTPYHLIVKKGNYYGIIDISGKILLPFEYDDIDESLESILTLRKDGKVFRKLFEDIVDEYLNNNILKIENKNKT